METEESSIRNESYTGAEPFLAGIAPSYWAHVPMTVADILYHVELKNGINCRMIMTMTTMMRRHNNNNNNKVMSIPVSKCLIVGYIVHTTIRSSDGSNTFVIDDGTGLIDCLQWSNNHHSTNTPEDIYHLPNLMLKNDDDDNNDNDEEETFQIGDLVRVYGKLKCLAETIDSKKNDNDNDNDNDTADGNNDRSTKTRVIREIVVTAMEKVATVPKKKSKKKRPHPFSSSLSLDAEARHWMKCFETNDANDNKEESSSLSSASSSSFHSYLHDLGPKIQNQVSRKMHLPSADDDTAAWRVFGPNCTCDLPYMSNLLYCHCQAKVITTSSSSIPPSMRMPQRWNKQKQASSSSLSSFDPNFVFRDAVLNVLLEWQSKKVKRLVFEYRKIKTHPKLIQVASQVVALTTTTGTGTGTTTPTSSTTTATTTTTNRHHPIDNTIYIDRLFRNTFSALRQDGIVYLQDPDTDLYLLITREKVLEPHVRNELKRLQKEKEEREKEEKERQRKELEGQDQEEEEKQPPTSNNNSNNNNNYHHYHYYKNKNYVNIQDVECLSNVHQERLCYIRRCLED